MAQLKPSLRWHPSALEDARRGPRVRRRFAGLTGAIRSRGSQLSERRWRVTVTTCRPSR